MHLSNSLIKYLLDMVMAMLSSGVEDDSLINSYSNYCDNLKNELVSSLEIGIKEGVKEGIEEGIKNGIKTGITECLNLRFINLRGAKIKDLDQILMEVSGDEIEEHVKNSIKKEICPIIENNVKNYCDSTLEAVKEKEIIVNEGAINLTRNKVFKKMIELKKEELEKNIYSYFPKNFVFISLSKRVETAICKCVIENINKCTKRIIQNSPV